MNKRIVFFVIFFMFVISISYGQQTACFNFKKFESSLLTGQGNSLRNNALPSISGSHQHPNSFLKYQLISNGNNPDNTQYNNISYRSLKIGKQIVLSQIPAALLAFGVAIAGSFIVPNGGIGTGTYLMYGGYIAGMTLGVNFFGNDKHEESTFLKTLAGSLLGLPIGYLIYKSDPKPHGFSALAPFIFPTLGAVISFNLTANPK